MSAYVTCTCGAEIDYTDRVCSLGHFQTWLPAAGRPVISVASYEYTRHGTGPVADSDYTMPTELSAQISATEDIPATMVYRVLGALNHRGVDIYRLVKKRHTP